MIENVKRSGNSKILDLKRLYLDKSATKAYWEKRWNLPTYEGKLEHELYNVNYRLTVDTYVEQNRIEKGHRVLDVGCGYGRIIIGLLKTVSGVCVAGIDLSEEVTRVAPDLIKKETGVTNIELHSASAEAIPFEDETFDSVISTRMLQYANNPDKVMAEVVRVLKAGGRATFMIPNRRNPAHYFTYHTRLLTCGDLEKWMEGAGLRVCKLGTLIFFPSQIRRWGSVSQWLSVEKALSKVPLINRIGGLAWVSAVKV